ncbi:uncharacterized protein LOC143023814 [Oratosquilla oratoria]|uniref:uncharacterized protein LOC143023814 n=1 Tax=Oratosquilla oratoria TaxID=337810 RepID=UPI003F777D90
MMDSLNYSAPQTYPHPSQRILHVHQCIPDQDVKSRSRKTQISPIIDLRTSHMLHIWWGESCSVLRQMQYTKWRFGGSVESGHQRGRGGVAAAQGRLHEAGIHVCKLWFIHL